MATILAISRAYVGGGCDGRRCVRGRDFVVVAAVVVGVCLAGVHTKAFVLSWVDLVPRAAERAGRWDRKRGCEICGTDKRASSGAGSNSCLPACEIDFPPLSHRDPAPLSGSFLHANSVPLAGRVTCSDGPAYSRRNIALIRQEGREFCRPMYLQRLMVPREEKMLLRYKVCDALTDCLVMLLGYM